jgi:hypothetical protein
MVKQLDKSLLVVCLPRRRVDSESLPPLSSRRISFSAQQHKELLPHIHPLPLDEDLRDIDVSFPVVGEQPHLPICPQEASDCTPVGNLTECELTKTLKS